MFRQLLRKGDDDCIIAIRLWTPYTAQVNLYLEKLCGIFDFLQNW